MQKLILLALLSSCTISFQNITTDGDATDVIDETQDISPNLDTDLSIPF
jgi:hypothetical protein